MLHLASDGDVKGAIIRGLFQCQPDIDLVRVQDVGLRTASDPVILEWTASQGRIVISHDRKTMAKHAYERVVKGLPIPGVLVIRKKTSVGRAIDEILIAYECSARGRMERPSRIPPPPTPPPTIPRMASVSVRDLAKLYPASKSGVRAVTLDIASGEHFILVGPSGAGKTTVLRLIAGLETPDAGTVCLSGKDVTRWPPHRRRVALVAQRPALYPQLTVRRNLSAAVEFRQDRGWFRRWFAKRNRDFVPGHGIGRAGRRRGPNSGVNRSAGSPAAASFRRRTTAGRSGPGVGCSGCGLAPG